MKALNSTFKRFFVLLLCCVLLNACSESEDNANSDESDSGASIVFAEDNRAAQPAEDPFEEFRQSLGMPNQEDELPQSYKEALDVYNKTGIENSTTRGDSFIPVPVDPTRDSHVVVPEENAPQQDPLERWRILQEQREYQARQLKNNPDSLQQPTSKTIDREKLNNRRIAETHRLQIETNKENLTELYNRDFNKCIELGCNVLSSSMHNNQSAFINARIPPESLNRFLQFLTEGLGTLVSHSVSADDKTLQYIDTESKLANQEALRHRLLTLLNSEDADDIESLLKIEMALARVEKELDTAKRTLRHLQTITGMATVAINYNVSREPAKVREVYFSDNFVNAWNSFKSSVADVIIFIGSVLPWIPIYLLILWAIIKTVFIALRGFGFKKGKQIETKSTEEPPKKIKK